MNDEGRRLHCESELLKVLENLGPCGASILIIDALLSAYCRHKKDKYLLLMANLGPDPSTLTDQLFKTH